MKKRYPSTYLDLSDMMHYKVHNGYEMNRVFGLGGDEFCIPQLLKKVMEFLFFKVVIERKQDLKTMEGFTKKYINPNVYFKGFYQSDRFFAGSESEVRKAFSFDMSKANSKSIEMAKTIDSDPRSTSIHIRRGDYMLPEHYKSKGSVCQLPYYLNAINELKNRVDAPRFYVFSDDMEWVKENLPLENAAYVDWNKGDDSWQDMMLMSHCHNNIICNSTFSWWGAWLNPNNEKIVLVPQKWSGTGARSKSYIYPKGWIKVKIE